jgi:transcriptional regulator with XRE-family HTH domain
MAEEIGERLRETRHQKNLSQKTVAETLDLTQQHYGGMERGERCITLIHFLRLAKEFDMSLDYILVGKKYGRIIALLNAHPDVDPDSVVIILTELLALHFGKGITKDAACLNNYVPSNDV